MLSLLFLKRIRFWASVSLKFRISSSAAILDSCYLVVLLFLYCSVADISADLARVDIF